MASSALHQEHNHPKDKEDMMSNVSIMAHVPKQSHLHVFGVHPDGSGARTFFDGSAWHKDWKVPEWSKPADSLVSVPVAVMGPQPNIVLAFAVNSENKLCISQGDSTKPTGEHWTEWAPIADNWHTAPVVSHRNQSTYAIYSIMANGQVRTVWDENSGASWSDTNLKGDAYAGMPAVATRPNEEHLVCRWPDGTYYYNYATTSQYWAAEWSKIGNGVFITDPTVVYRSEDKDVLCVFGLGKDKCIYYDYLMDGKWTEAGKISDPMSQKPVAVASGPNLDLFGVKPDGTIAHRPIRNKTNWLDWEELDGIKAVCQPAATIRADGTVDLVATDSSNTVYVRSLKSDITGGKWDPKWTPIGQGLQTAAHLLQA